MRCRNTTKVIPGTQSPDLAAFEHVGVIGRAYSQRRDKFSECGVNLEKIQMRPTTAIGSAEAKWRRSSAERLGRLGPQTFPADRIVTEPDRLKSGALPQVVDVPVRPSRRSAMMAQAARDAAGAERAAEIKRPTRRQRQPPPTDGDRFLKVEPQQQRIGSWLASG